LPLLACPGMVQPKTSKRRPGAEPSIKVIIRAESEGDLAYKFEDELPIDQPVARIAKAWSHKHAVPEDSVAFEDVDGREVDCSKTPAELGWQSGKEVELNAFPTDEKYMENVSCDQRQETGSPSGGSDRGGKVAAPAVPAATATPAPATAEAKEPGTAAPAAEATSTASPEAPSKRARTARPSPEAPPKAPDPKPSPKPASKATKEPPPATSKEKAVKPLGGGGGNVGPLKEDDRIEYSQDNPKKAGSDSYNRYEKYKKAQTVKEALELGAAKGDITHDFKRGFIKRL